MAGTRNGHNGYARRYGNRQFRYIDNGVGGWIAAQKVGLISHALLDGGAARGRKDRKRCRGRGGPNTPAPGLRNRENGRIGILVDKLRHMQAPNTINNKKNQRGRL